MNHQTIETFSCPTSRFSFRATAVGLGLAASFLLSSATLAHDQTRCPEARFVEVGETLRPGPALGRSCYETLLPNPGRLAIEVAVPSHALVEPEVRSDETCADFDAARVSELGRRSADHLLLAVASPGSYRFCIAAQDPLAVLGESVIRMAFAAATEDSAKEGNPEEEEVDPNPNKEGNPEEEEVDPNPNKEGNPEEEEVDPNPSVWQPDGFVDTAGDARRPDTGWHATLCSATTSAAPRALLRCATSLAAGETVRGVLDNGWGDDRRVFSFILDRLTTVELSGQIEGTDLTLLDTRGERLRRVEGDATLRWVKTLGAGRYHLRLDQAVGGVVPFELSLTTLDK